MPCRQQARVQFQPTAQQRFGRGELRQAQVGHPAQQQQPGVGRRSGQEPVGQLRAGFEAAPEAVKLRLQQQGFEGPGRQLLQLLEVGLGVCLPSFSQLKVDDGGMDSR